MSYSFTPKKLRSKKVYFPLVILTTGLFLLVCNRSIANIEIPTQINSVETVVSDMRSPHEGRPHGIPDSYDWALVPRLSMGNEPGEFKAMIAWGQLYEDIEGNPASNTRVQIREIKAYRLSKQDKQWYPLQVTFGIEGSAYREDFVENKNKPADLQQEEDGSISVKVGKGYNFHFWPSTGRVPINPNDIGGIFTTVEARLIVDTPTKADDRNQARYLLSMGGDYWLTPTAPWNHWKTNGDIAIGRFKYVKSEWQAFNMTTMPESEFRRNPPPLR